jgi:hypothetical protein
LGCVCVWNKKAVHEQAVVTDPADDYKRRLPASRMNTVLVNTATRGTERDVHEYAVGASKRE